VVGFPILWGKKLSGAFPSAPLPIVAAVPAPMGPEKKKARAERVFAGPSEALEELEEPRSLCAN
jgi:hypothetical protein